MIKSKEKALTALATVSMFFTWMKKLKRNSNLQYWNDFILNIIEDKEKEKLRKTWDSPFQAMPAPLKRIYSKQVTSSQFHPFKEAIHVEEKLQTSVIPETKPDYMKSTISEDVGEAFLKLTWVFEQPPPQFFAKHSIQTRTCEFHSF